MMWGGGLYGRPRTYLFMSNLFSGEHSPTSSPQRAGGHKGPYHPSSSTHAPTDILILTYCCHNHRVQWCKRCVMQISLRSAPYSAALYLEKEENMKVLF